MFKEEHEREERKRKDKEERKDSVSIAKEEIILSLYEVNMYIYGIDCTDDFTGIYLSSNSLSCIH